MFKLLHNSWVATQNVVNFIFRPFRKEMRNFHTSQNKTNLFLSFSAYLTEVPVVTRIVAEMYVHYRTAYTNGWFGYCVNGSIQRNTRIFYISLLYHPEIWTVIWLCWCHRKKSMKLTRSLKVFPRSANSCIHCQPSVCLSVCLSLMINEPYTLLPAQVIACLSLLNIVWIQPLGGMRAIYRSTLKEKAQQLEEEVEEFETSNVFSWPQCCINTLRTGILNCLNARSRGLTFRHRASCI